MNIFEISLFGGLILSQLLRKKFKDPYQNLNSKKRVILLLILLFIIVIAGSIEFNNLIPSLSSSKPFQSFNGFCMGFSLQLVVVLLFDIFRTKEKQ